MSGKLLVDTLKGTKGPRVPFWFMRQAGRYLPEYREIRARCDSFWDLCLTPDLAAEVTLQPVRRFRMDAAILFSDILVVPLAIGCDIRFAEGEGPVLRPVATQEDIRGLKIDETKLAPVYEALEKTCAKLPGNTAMIGFAGAPWTVACYMVEGGRSREFEKVRIMSLGMPAVFSNLIARLEEATASHLAAQVKAGADVLQLFDSWAGLLPPDEFERWVIAPTQRIVSALKSLYPHVPIVGFPRLAGNKYAEYASATGVDAISVDPAVSLPHLVSGIPMGKCTALQGNLDPYMLAHDLPAALRSTQDILAQCSRIPLVFNLGHGMLPATPVGHVQALCDFLKENRLETRKARAV